MREIKRLVPDVTCTAIGSHRLRDAGANIIIDSSDWASIGPVSALLKIPPLLVTGWRTANALCRRPPRLVIPVDFGALNLRLVLELRRRRYSGTIVYYFPPGAWLDNERQARAVAGGATPLTAFTHQRDFYHGLGLRCEYFGYPLVSVIEPRTLVAPAWPPEFGLPASPGPRIVVFPGSRHEEIALMVPRLARAAALLGSANASFVVAAVSEARAKQIQKLWARDGEVPFIARGDAIERAMASADLAWVASGTAVLETALRSVPQIAFYAITPAQYRIAQRRVPQIVAGPLTLPNLVLGRGIVPELLQDELTPANLAAQTRALLADASARAAQLRGDAELREQIGPPDALTRIARFVVEQLEEARRTK